VLKNQTIWRSAVKATSNKFAVSKIAAVFFKNFILKTHLVIKVKTKDLPPCQ